MRCRVGDLAEIINSMDGLMVGRFVEVRVFAGFHSKLGPMWLVRSNTADLVTEYGGLGPECHMPDDWLRPIRPDTKAANDSVFKSDELALVDPIAA